ncbi:class I SAM-dependent methyltransferase [Paenibacillus sp. LHD-117]|uniref:class I SAM-dependent methyltransferase n=1 Tax=Paenibacillus sp. LHD-117 TaxID=3071412 RepID=UPI0027E01156|nr:class I SAM-dependent methyltransferase [Paenibacillus sp. LHD-117]MDQ6422465.1 class I SAM-dependent methyltransferase [Paenibacillus sp. LHD-117]
MEDRRSSRFFVAGDASADTFLFKLPPTWWSRPYEYEWAKEFVRQDNVVLDAACGISHPFKFVLSELCREVHACDIDPRITSPDEIVLDIENDFGAEAARQFPRSYLNIIRFCRANLASLPYGDRTFDRIFCISVLEHLDFGTMLRSFHEFRRILKDDGKLVVTFDYPIIQFDALRAALADAGLVFASDVYYEMPDDALYSDLYGVRLFCFRAVFGKKTSLP